MNPIGPCHVGYDPDRDALVQRVSEIASRHHYGEEPTRADVSYLLEVIAALPHGVNVAFCTPLTLRRNALEADNG